MDKKERVNYIVLDGANAILSADANHLKWNIADHYFIDYKNEDDVYITMINAVFAGAYSTSHDTSQMYSSEVFCDLIPYNSTHSNNENLLKIVDSLDDDINKIVSSGYHNSSTMKVKVGNKFHSIEIYVRSHGDLLDFTTVDDNVSKDYCKFVLKVEYKNSSGLN